MPRKAKAGAERPLIKNIFKCIVPGCLSSTTSNIAKLHSFPWRDMPRAERWMAAVGRCDLVGCPPKALFRLRVCDLHFHRKLRRGKNLKLFDRTAVPTLRLTRVQPAAPATAPRAATPPRASPATTTPSNGTQVPVRVPKDLARFLTLRETLAAPGAAGGTRRALRLRHAAPGAYEALWRALRLPSPSSLARPWPALAPNPAPALLATLRLRLRRLPPADRRAVLCLAEVPLSGRAFYALRSDRLLGLEELPAGARAAPADCALLLVARGAGATRWTQPLAYCALACDADPREAAAAVRAALDALDGIGAPVAAVLAALGPTFSQLARALGATPARPDVRVGGLRAPFLHDPEQLILTLRDTLRAYDVLLRGADGERLRARWADLEAIAAEDCARPGGRLLPELTRARLCPSPEEAVGPRHARAVLSRRVGAALAAGGEARAGTARLVRLSGALAAALRSLRPEAAARARLARVADAAEAALGDVRVVSWAGEEHDAEELARALRLTLAGARLAAAEGALPLERCGPRPLRRWAERAETAAAPALPDARRVVARFERWAGRELARPVEARATPDDLQALLAAAEEPESQDEVGDQLAAPRAAPLRHRPAARCDAAGAAAALLREMRRAHGCATWRRVASDGRRWGTLVSDLEARFKRLWAGQVAGGAGRGTAAALRAAVEARAPCECFPRETLCRLFTRFRLRAALLAHNARLVEGAAGRDEWSFA